MARTRAIERETVPSRRTQVIGMAPSTEKTIGFLSLFCLLSSTVIGRTAGKYLTARYHPDAFVDVLTEVSDRDNVTTTTQRRVVRNSTLPHLVEFWPGYRPVHEWMITREGHVKPCDYDFDIGLLPFDSKRVVDYEARRVQLLPVLDLTQFSNVDLSYVVESAVDDDGGCRVCKIRYDSVFYEPPYRFHAFQGFRQFSYDTHADFFRVGYAPVPFLRNVDAAYVDPKNVHLRVYLSNDWYYIFDTSRGGVHFARQGHVSNLLDGDWWVDAVLTLRNGSLCRFRTEMFRCDRGRSVPLERLFETEDAATGKILSLPIRSAFQLHRHQGVVDYGNGTVLLDSNNVFWIYDDHSHPGTYALEYTLPFCDFLFFSRFPCCTDRDKGTITDDDSEEEGSGR